MTKLCFGQQTLLSYLFTCLLELYSIHFLNEIAIVSSLHKTLLLHRFCPELNLSTPVLSL